MHRLAMPGFRMGSLGMRRGSAMWCWGAVRGTAAMRFGMRGATAAAFVVVMFLGERRHRTCDQADNCGRDKKFAHEIHPLITDV